MVKRVGSSFPEGDDAKKALGQLTWNLHHGPREAWKVAKARAHFGEAQAS